MGDRKNGPGENGGKDRDSGQPATKKERKSDQVGRALRSVYDDMLREDVPDEFQDLLDKLG